MRVILCLLMVCGMAAMTDAIFKQAAAVAVWSNFKAYETKAEAMENGRAVLDLAGQKDAVNFPRLLDRLLQLGDRVAGLWIGLATFVLSFTALVLTTRQGNGPGGGASPFSATNPGNKSPEDV
jgi:hypothetical protein